MDHLAELGWITASFQGSRYYVFDGETGRDLFWLSGELRCLLSQLAATTWRLELEMTGVLGSPWPDRSNVSGSEWTNPEGDLIPSLPYIDSLTTLTIDSTVCSSSRVSLDTEEYSLVNCEVVLQSDIIFLTFYLSGEDSIMGGVTTKRQYDEYLQLDSPGFLLDRWSFAT